MFLVIILYNFLLFIFLYILFYTYILYIYYIVYYKYIIIFTFVLAVPQSIWVLSSLTRN